VTVRDWLLSRRPSPPAALTGRLTEALRDRLDDDASTMYDCAMDAALALLASVVRQPTAGRECALDLLTADALTTYAFEAAAEEPEKLGERSQSAMRRFAEVGVRSVS